MAHEQPTIDHYDIVMSTTERGLARVEAVSRFAEDGEKLALETATKYASGWQDRFILVRAHRTDGSVVIRMLIYPIGWPRTIRVAA